MGFGQILRYGAVQLLLIVLVLGSAVEGAREHDPWREKYALCNSEAATEENIKINEFANRICLWERRIHTLNTPQGIYINPFASFAAEIVS
jgi:hypothetical protein